VAIRKKKNEGGDKDKKVGKKGVCNGKGGKGQSNSHDHKKKRGNGGGELGRLKLGMDGRRGVGVKDAGDVNKGLEEGPTGGGWHITGTAQEKWGGKKNHDQRKWSKRTGGLLKEGVTGPIPNQISPS